MAERINYPPSVQSDLFQYLNPRQQAFIKPILRVLKRKAQEELCTALIAVMRHYLITTDFILRS